MRFLLAAATTFLKGVPTLSQVIDDGLLLRLLMVHCLIVKGNRVFARAYLRSRCQRGFFSYQSRTSDHRCNPASLGDIVSNQWLLICLPTVFDTHFDYCDQWFKAYLMQAYDLRLCTEITSSPHSDSFWQYTALETMLIQLPSARHISC